MCTGHKHWILFIAWAPDGKKLASACKKGEVGCSMIVRVQSLFSLKQTSRQMLCKTLHNSNNYHLYILYVQYMQVAVRTATVLPLYCTTTVLYSHCTVLPMFLYQCTHPLPVLCCQCIRVLSDHTHTVSCIKFKKGGLAILMYACVLLLI